MGRSVSLRYPATVDLDLGHFRIRDFVPDDAASLAANANDERIARWTSDRFPHPYTLEHAREFIARAATTPQWAIDVAGEVVGGIGLFPKGDVYRRGVDLGYWLAPAYWGHGIATAAVRAICERTFASGDLERIQALVIEGNAGSIRVLEKAGFTLEGVHRRAVIKRERILDELVFARLRDP